MSNDATLPAGPRLAIRTIVNFRDTMNDFLLLILSSPSGAGKTTLKTRILPRATPSCASRSRTRRASRAPTRSTGASTTSSTEPRSEHGRRAARSPSGPRCTATSTAPALREIERGASHAPRRRLRHRLPGRAANQGEAPRGDRGLHPAPLDGRARAPPARRAPATTKRPCAPSRQRARPRSSTTGSSTTWSSTTTSTQAHRKLDAIVPPSAPGASATRVSPSDSCIEGSSDAHLGCHRGQRSLRARWADGGRNRYRRDAVRRAERRHRARIDGRRHAALSCRVTDAVTASADAHQLPRERLRA